MMSLLGDHLLDSMLHSILDLHDLYSLVKFVIVVPCKAANSTNDMFILIITYIDFSMYYN